MPEEQLNRELDVALRALFDPEALMMRIVNEALLLIPHSEGSVIELIDGENLYYAHAAGNLSSHLGLRLRAEESLSGLSVREGVTLRCDDSEIDPRVDAEACRRVNARSMVCVPLRRVNRPVGVLKVTSTRPSAFSDSDAAMLAGLSSFITATITALADVGSATFTTLDNSWISQELEATKVTSPISTFLANVLRPGVVEDLEVAKRVQSVLADRMFNIVYQPIFDLNTGHPMIWEALSRFSTVPHRSPSDWFHDAWRIGLGPELEFATASAALKVMGALPNGCRVAINLSPQLIEHPNFTLLLEMVDHNRLVIEITEHFDADNFERIRRILEPHRRNGIHVAMDDTGNGFSSLSSIIELSPEIIKLDFGLVHGIDFDPVRRSLATALVDFANTVNAIVVAEGIETEDELRTVRSLGVHYGQGFFLARPGPVSRVVSLPLNLNRQ